MDFFTCCLIGLPVIALMLCHYIILIFSGLYNRYFPVETAPTIDAPIPQTQQIQDDLGRRQQRKLQQLCTDFNVLKDHVFSLTTTIRSFPIDEMQTQLSTQEASVDRCVSQQQELNQHYDLELSSVNTRLRNLDNMTSKLSQDLQQHSSGLQTITTDLSSVKQMVQELPPELLENINTTSAGLKHHIQRSQKQHNEIVNELKLLSDFETDIEDFINGQKFTQPFIDSLLKIVQSRFNLDSSHPRVHSTTPHTSIPKNQHETEKMPPTSPSFMSARTYNSPERKHSSATIPPSINAPPPRFNPEHDIPEFFLEELNQYLYNRGVPENDRMNHLQSIFSKERELNLWWQRTRLQVSSWKEFCSHFLKMFGTPSDYTSSLEKLLARRQKPNEKFSTFAMEMELNYLKLHRNQQVDQNTLLTFISERALSWMVPHLLECNAHDIYELIQFASRIPPPTYQPNTLAQFPSKPHSNTFHRKPFISAAKSSASSSSNPAHLQRPATNRINNINTDPIGEEDLPTVPDEQMPNFNKTDTGSLVLCNSICDNTNILPTVHCTLKAPNNDVLVTGKCLFDSGASISILGDRRLWAEQHVKHWSRGPIRLANGECVMPEGKMDFKFKLGNRWFTHTFALLPGIEFTVILGLDFLRNSGITINFQHMKYWYFDTPQLQFTFSSTPTNSTDLHTLHLLNEFQEKQIQTLLKKFATVVDSPTLGRTDLIEHEIHLREEKPRIIRPFPYSDAKHKIIDELVEEMLQQGLIRESPMTTTGYSSPVILRPKPSGDWRIVNDFRYVNDLTITDGFPMRRIEDVLRLLSKANYLSTIDCEKGFWQVPVREQDKHYTTFRTRKGIFEYNVMPQGMKNSPMTFQRLMTKVLKGLDAFSFVYQDDILVFSSSFEDHLKHLEIIFQRLQAAHLTVKSSKCAFGKDKVKFLGYIISTKGIEKNPDKVNAVLSLSAPKTRTQLRKFLGAVCWFRNFIPQLANTAEPLYRLLSTKTKFKWNQDADLAFQDLKHKLSMEVTLQHPDMEKPFIIRTDGAQSGVGCILLQKDNEGNERPVAFASKTLNAAQRNYSAIEIECYAIVYALERFAEYLDGGKFTIETDNQAITYLQKMRNTNSRLTRWAWKIQEWCPSILHISGINNPVADYLSRYTDDDSVQLHLLANMHESTPYTESILKAAQHEDIECKQHFNKFPDQFSLSNGIIYRRDGSLLVPFLPKSLRETFMQHLHDHPTSGHLGVTKTLEKLKTRVFFPGMRKFVQSYISTCDKCQRNKYSNTKSAGLMGLKPITRPWHTVYLDLMGPFPPSQPNRFSYVLVAVDGFSKYVEILPLRDATSESIRRALDKEVFSRYGPPIEIVTDNATSFKSSTIKQLCAFWKTTHRFASIYHPQTNLSERVNRVLKPMIRMYVENQPHKKWADHLHQFRFAINTSTNESTKFSPYQIMFNSVPRLPLDNLIRNETNDNYEYDFDLNSRIQQHQKLVSQVEGHLKSSQNKQKIQYDKNHTPTKFKIDDLVVIKDNTLSSKDKGICSSLCPLYSSKTGKITKIISENTFEVTFEDGTIKGPIHSQLLRKYNKSPESSPPLTVIQSRKFISGSPSPPDEEQTSNIPVRVLRPRPTLNYRDINLGRTRQ